MKNRTKLCRSWNAASCRWASVADAPVGVRASTVSTSADILSYSRGRGLFAGTNLNCSAITEDRGDARNLYGSPVPLADILAGKAQAPNAGRSFVNEAAKYVGHAGRGQ
jgi:SH3 domain-containing YSC84-like protein 1